MAFFWAMWGWLAGVTSVLLGRALAKWAGREYRRRKRSTRVLMTEEEYLRSRQK